ncbi:MAG: outer membrane protein [Terracidiphilus sp.]
MIQRKSYRGWHGGLALAALLAAAAAHGQTAPAANGGGASLWAGAEYSNMQAGFPNGSSVRLDGIGGFAGYNWNHSFGVEGHIRFLNFNSWYGESQQDYLAGPRYTFLHNDRWRPFAAFEVGAVKIQYPFSLGTGTSFAMAPSGGLEYRLGRKWSVRGAYEYQFLPNSPDFTDEPKFGIRPNGILAGISYRIF